MKKLINTIISLLSAALLIQTVSFAYWDVPAGSGCYAAVERLTELGIVSGYSDGSYWPDATLTRAEFAKLVICMIDKETEAISTGYASSFSDVGQGEWYVPYVNYAANTGIVTGYADGSFGPDKSISYAEAATIILRILGYSEADVGGYWPNNYFNAANSMRLAGDAVGDPYAPVNRATAAIMLDTALFSDVNSLAASRSSNPVSLKYTANKTLLDAIGYTVLEDEIIIASGAEDSSLGSDKIYTSSGKYNIGTGNVADYVGQKGDLCLKDDEVLFFIPTAGYSITSYNVTNTIGSDMILDDAILDISDSLPVYYKTTTMTYSSAVSRAEKNDTFRLVTNGNGSAEYGILVATHSSPETNLLDKYVIYSVLNNAVICYHDGVMSQLDMKDSTPCYRDNSTSSSTFASMKSEMEMGDVLYAKMSGSSVEYISYEKGNTEGPVKVISAEWINSFETNSQTKIMRDGVSSDVSAVQTNDIIYYSPDLNMVLAYSKKITGVYESASPSKDSPTSVTISGTSYDVESVEAFNDLSSSGSLKYGDTITVCLGKDGKKIAGVVTASAAVSGTVTGYVTASGRKSFVKSDGTEYTSYYLTIVTAGGITADYPVTENLETSVSKVVKAVITNGVAKIAPITSASNITGTVDTDTMTIGSNKIAEGCDIIDTNNAGYQKPALYKKIYAQRINGVTLSAGQVLYCEKNSNGEISQLILKNVSNDMYTYGVVTGHDNNFTIDVDGVIATYAASIVTDVGIGPVKASIKSNSVTDIESLKSYIGNISDLSTETALISGTTYRLSDKVVCYSKATGTTYQKISIDDAINGSYSSRTAYYDKTEDKGGRIRIIICTPKQ